MRACMCIMCVTGGQKRVLETLEWELQKVVSCHMGAGSKAPLQEQQVFLTTEQSLNLQICCFIFQMGSFYIALGLLSLYR